LVLVVNIEIMTYKIVMFGSIIVNLFKYSDSKKFKPY